MVSIKRGDICLANLDPVRGSEQGKVRPILIIQNDISNQHSPTTIIAPITSKIYAKEYPTNVKISKSNSSLGGNLNPIAFCTSTNSCSQKAIKILRTY